MNQDLRDFLATDEVRALIRHKAARFRRTTRLRHADPEDVEQQLHLHLAESFDRYEPERGSRIGFAEVVAHRHVISLARAARAQCRNPDRVRSLDAPIAGAKGAPTDMASRLPETAHQRRLCRRALSDCDYRDLIRDHALVADRLTPRQRQIAALLMRGTIADAARELQIPRTTLYADVATIRAHFEAAGMRRYLDRGPTPRRASA
jgi:transcriptional regulator of acetoin/glycerol metabolism